ncbi:MAG: hypothetical protein J7L23_01470 [Candidatus Diapherotrites archaeon]|nr:hypothetical protein [Candidatus Diapherotrites archaeon]
MECKSQTSLEVLLLLAAFIAFISVLLHAETRFNGRLIRRHHAPHWSNPAAAFGKSRAQEANFTRWFR